MNLGRIGKNNKTLEGKKDDGEAGIRKLYILITVIN